MNGDSSIDAVAFGKQIYPVLSVCQFVGTYPTNLRLSFYHNRKDNKIFITFIDYAMPRSLMTHIADTSRQGFFFTIT